MPRTITLNYDPADFTTCMDTISATHSVGYDVLLPEFERAVGYLSTWGAGGSSYTHLRLYLMPTRGEITACYYDSTGPEAKNTFVMCGVWHPLTHKFQFHS